MDIYQTIADFLNGLLGALRGLASIGNLIPGASTSSIPREPTPAPAPGPARPPIQSGGHTPTMPVNITAHFFSTGSPAWANQVILAEDGKTYRAIHGGTDYSAPPGSPVFAAKDMSVIAIGHYSDAGRLGDYVIGNWPSGEQYYSGHLDNIRVRVGDAVKAGEQIGQTNQYAHTHIQLKRGNVYLDPEKYI